MSECARAYVVCVCVCVCVRACVRACVHACVRAVTRLALAKFCLERYALGGQSVGRPSTQARECSQGIPVWVQSVRVGALVSLIATVMLGRSYGDTHLSRFSSKAASTRGTAAANGSAGCA